jgi:hypothetical protein
MSEDKFTRGPWHYDADFKSIYNKQCNYICDAPLNNAADKHLIAAAPEMYDFIKKVFDIQKNHYGYAMELHMAMIRLAEESEQLLAKARGEA